MKRVIPFLVVLLALATMAKANPIDVNDARKVGMKFVNANTKVQMRTADNFKLAATYRTQRGEAAFYVFNTGTSYVIVSADDCAAPILGYSKKGEFDSNNLPVQLESYLQHFVEQIEYGIENHLAADEEIAQQWASVRSTGYVIDQRGTTAVEPLLTDIWNQSCYYNDLCPVDENGPCGHVYAGCVATSFSQIMHYWQYPTTGTGSHTYNPSGYPQQTANFGATTYDWSNMPNYLSSSSPAAQINAIATLMWHCGVAVDMGYGPGGSYAYSSDVVSALVNYFGYSSDLSGIYKYYYTNAQWLNLVKGSLDVGCPVHYSGNDGTGASGHAFVCDGYDSNDFLHFNWGWGGYYNDYYALDALIPTTGHNYSYGNYAIINIHPNCPPNTYYQVTATSNNTAGGTVTGTGTYACGTTCSVTATPASGYLFCSWTENGEVVSTNPTYSFLTFDNRNLVANFIEDSDGCTLVFELNDSYGDGWTGNTLVVNYSVGCFTEEQMTMETGSSITLTRNVFNGCHITLSWISGNWEDECSFTIRYESGAVIYQGSNLNSNFQYEFDVNCGATYTITTSSNPSNAGSTSGGGFYLENTVCTLTATPYMGYYFDNWTKDGVVVSSNAIYSFTVTEDAAYVANFTDQIPTPTFPVTAQYYPDATNPASPYVKVEWGDAIVQDKGDRAPWDLMASFNAAEGGQYGVATDGQNIYTCNWGYSGATYNFYKYDLQGNMIEGFNVAGCGTIRDLTYDGQYFYGGANSNTLYCVDLANKTLIGSVNTVCSGIRHCSYDPVNDGFWVGGWNDLMLINRNGALIQNGPVVTSCSGTGYFTASDGSAHLYLFCQPNSEVKVYDYNISTSTVYMDPIFDLANTPGYNGGSSGGAFIGNYNGKVAFFGDMQQTPNLIGIYELADIGTLPQQLGYRVYRTTCNNNGPYTSSNTTLLADNVAGSPYIDQTWSDLTVGSYKFGVSVLWEGGSESDIIWSDCIDKEDVPIIEYYTVTATANPADGGVITGDGLYESGASCTLTATANSGYTFVSWKENNTVVSTNSSYTFTVSQDRTLVAEFLFSPIDVVTAEYYPDASNPNSPYAKVAWSPGLPTGEWHYYDNGNYVTGIGTNGGTFSWAVMFPAGTYSGNTVPKVAAFDTEAMSGTVTIYSGGSTVPGTAVGSMNITFTGAMDFVEFVFPSPVVINPSQNLWVVFTNLSGANFPAAACNDTGDPNGRWVYLDGDGWFDLASVGLNYTFMLRAYVIDGKAEATDREEARTAKQIQSFKVYRTDCSNNGPYTAANTVLVASNVTDNYYIDNGWENLSEGSYKYGVSAVNTNGEESARVWSNCLEKSAPVVTYTITATANPTAGGTVTGGGTFTPGSVCTLTATANTGYTFTNWTKNGTVVSANNTFSFNVTENATYVANFTLNSYTVTVSVEPMEGGVVTGGGSYTYGQTATVSVMANPNYYFDNWTENGNVVSTNADYTFTVTGNRVLVAHLTFVDDVEELKAGTLSVFPNPVKEKLTVVYSERVSSCEVYDVKGALVQTVTDCSAEFEVDVKQLPAGTYLLRLTTDSGMVTQRFVKE